METAPPTPAAAELSPAVARAVLAATIIASAMGFIDGTVVNIALPAIQTGLDAGFDAVQWVANAYALMLGALILVAGGLGDRFGRRLVFLAGLVTFTAASLACALAGNIAFLIAARALQEIGAALLIPQSLAIITATFPRHIRGRAIGTWAAASAATTALGPALGGFLIDALSWRAAFWINLPLAAVTIWLTVRSVPESRNPEARGRLDLVGAMLAIVGFGLVTYGLTGLSGLNAGTGALVAAAGLGVIVIAAFVWWEGRTDNPVMPPALFRSRTFSGANIFTVFLYGCLAAVLFLLPFDLIARRGLSATAAGLTMMPVGLIIAAFSRTAGGLADRIGPRPFLVLGPIAVALACAGLALGPGNYLLGVLLPVLLLAAGMAVVVSPLTTAVMNAAPEGRSGAASGVNNAASRVAGLVAVAGLGALASLVFHAEAEGLGDRFGVLPPATDVFRAPLEAAFRSAYSAAMWGAAMLAALAAATAWAFIDRDATPAAGNA